MNLSFEINSISLEKKFLSKFRRNEYEYTNTHWLNTKETHTLLINE